MSASTTQPRIPLSKGVLEQIASAVVLARACTDDELHQLIVLLASRAYHEGGADTCERLREARA